MKVLLIGANGQLGTDLLKVLQGAGDAVVPVASRRCPDGRPPLAHRRQPPDAAHGAGRADGRTGGDLQRPARQPLLPVVVAVAR